METRTLAEAVAARRDTYPFDESQRDLAEVTDTPLRPTVGVDMETLRSNLRKPFDYSGWYAQGREQFLEAVTTVPAVAIVEVNQLGRYTWEVALDPETLTPISAFKKIRRTT